MEWWIWASAGLLLLGLEVVTAGFYVFFFGIGALAAAGLAACGVKSPAIQVAVFAVVSAVSLLLLRKRLLAKFQVGKHLSDSLADIVGGVATLQEDVATGAQGKAEYRGAPWTVKNTSAAPLTKGQRCRIESIDGLTLRVVPE